VRKSGRTSVFIDADRLAESGRSNANKSVSATLHLQGSTVLYKSTLEHNFSKARFAQNERK
jgi:hypothetical protein